MFICKKIKNGTNQTNSMKVRDSGMPPETVWSAFFDVDTLLDKMQVNQSVNNLMEVGCGYGTFTIAAAIKIGIIIEIKEFGKAGFISQLNILYR